MGSRRFTAHKRSNSRNGEGTRRGASPLRRIIERNLDHADRLLPRYGQPRNGICVFTYTNAVPESGIKIVLEETGLEDEMKDADFITGEGRG